MGTRKSWRRRIVLLLMAVVPQVLSLAGLGAIFWFVRIKDIVQGPATFSRAAEGLWMELYLPQRDGVKLEVGSELYAAIVKPTGEVGGEFRTTVRGMAPVELEVGSELYNAIALPAGEGARALPAPQAGAGGPAKVPAWKVTARVSAGGEPLPPEVDAFAETTQETAVMGWTRTRRALTVIRQEELGKANKSAARGALGLGGGR